MMGGMGSVRDARASDLCPSVPHLWLQKLIAKPGSPRHNGFRRQQLEGPMATTNRPPATHQSKPSDKPVIREIRPQPSPAPTSVKPIAPPPPPNSKTPTDQPASSTPPPTPPP